MACWVLVEYMQLSNGTVSVTEKLHPKANNILHHYKRALIMNNANAITIKHIIKRENEQYLNLFLSWDVIDCSGIGYKIQTVNAFSISYFHCNIYV